MSISELDNTPVDITLAGRKLKIQRLSIRELFTPAETKIQKEYIANVQEIAKGLTGKDKTDFMITALKDMPKGQALEQQALDYMATPIGIAQVLMLGLNKCQAISEDDVANLMLKASESELGFIREYLAGESSETTVDAEKKQ
jgi:ABC-type Zn uptake system ZnuABC Zn-binding protein ZnuA